MMKTPAHSPLISRPFQSLLLAVASLYLLIQAIQAVQFIIIAYPGGGVRVSEWSVYTGALLLLPLLSFAAGYILWPTFEGRRQKAFMALLFTFLFLQINSVASIFARIFLFPLLSLDLLTTAWSQLLPSAVALLLLIVGLTVWRHRKKAHPVKQTEFLILAGSIYGIAIGLQIWYDYETGIHIDGGGLSSLLFTGSLIVTLTLLVASTYFLQSAQLGSRLRLIRSLMYPLVTVLIFACFNLALAIAALASNGTLNYAMMNTIGTPVVGVIVLGYIITLVILRRQKKI